MSRRHDEFEEFARARTPQLYRSAWMLCGDAHRAEDLVQDTLAKVFVRWHRPLVRAIDNPAAYAHTTLVRTYISAQRRRSTHERPTEHLPERADYGGERAVAPPGSRWPPPSTSSPRSTAPCWCCATSTTPPSPTPPPRSG